jgi:hypothetical protein
VVRHCSYTPCDCGGADVVDGATEVVVDGCGAFVVEHAGTTVNAAAAANIASARRHRGIGVLLASAGESRRP